MVVVMMQRVVRRLKGRVLVVVLVVARVADHVVVAVTQVSTLVSVVATVVRRWGVRRAKLRVGVVVGVHSRRRCQLDYLQHRK